MSNPEVNLGEFWLYGKSGFEADCEVLFSP